MLKKFLTIGYWLLIILISAPARADQTTVSLTNPLQAEDIPSLTGSIIKAVLGIIGAIALLMFIWGGFLWLTAAGSPDKIEKGKNTLIWATFGLILIFSSYIIANFIIQSLTKGS